MELVRQHWIVKRFMIVTMVILSIFIALLFLPWQQTVYGVGRLEAYEPVQRGYDVVATVSGVVDRYFVAENEAVQKGEPLFQMRDLDPKYQKRLRQMIEQNENERRRLIESIQNYEKKIDLERKKLQERLATTQKKRRQLLERREGLEAQIEATKNLVAIQRAELERKRILYKDGIVSKRDLQKAQNMFLSAKAKLQTQLSDLKALNQEFGILRKRRKILKHEAEQKIKDAQTAILNAKRDIAKLDQQREKLHHTLSRYRSRTIHAKSDGFVVRIYRNDKNRYLKKGEKILFFMPKVTQRAIRLKVSDFYMPLIKKGLKTRIIFYGWPALQISGWPKISHGTYGGVVRSVEPLAKEPGVYYAWIVEDPDDDPWPSERYLKIGTQASVWVRLAVVPIWYEIWRLMASQPPKMVTPSQVRKW